MLAEEYFVIIPHFSSSTSKQHIIRQPQPVTSRVSPERPDHSRARRTLHCGCVTLFVNSKDYSKLTRKWTANFSHGWTATFLERSRGARRLRKGVVSGIVREKLQCLLWL